MGRPATGKRRGRPALTNSRNTEIRYRVSAEERTQTETEARAARQDVSTFVRSEILTPGARTIGRVVRLHEAEILTFLSDTFTGAFDALHAVSPELVDQVVDELAGGSGEQRPADAAYRRRPESSAQPTRRTRDR